MTYRNPAYLALARGKPCVGCGAQDGTVVAAHYCGMGADQLGRGASQKPHDFCVAFLCSRCHARFDAYETANSYPRSRDFALYCLKSLALVLETGEVEIVPVAGQGERDDPKAS